MKKNKTLAELANEIYKLKNYEEENQHDYFLTDRVTGQEEVKPYDDFYAVTRFGSVEGIYTDFYVVREGDDRDVKKFASAKTLWESDDAFIEMSEFGAKMALALRKAIEYMMF